MISLQGTNLAYDGKSCLLQKAELNITLVEEEKHIIWIIRPMSSHQNGLFLLHNVAY